MGKIAGWRLELGSAESSPKRGVHWVLIGDPGLKKHVYAERLSKLLEVPHISMGSLVRQEPEPRSSLYKRIANAVNEGKLVREDVIFALLSKRLEEGYYRGDNGFILDGIPRTRIQAEILDQIVDIDLVVNFKCTEKHLVKKKLDGEAFSPRWEFLSTRSSRFSTVEATAAWTEKFRIYAEQSFYMPKARTMFLPVCFTLVTVKCEIWWTQETAQKENKFY
ncbi:probable adenylate kinase 7, mitochondrial [Mangifera indica]|uniref:probable adenylate kinase 7, mitochondrial n=1 Tax=Mangifera indica TaxID=29780 RepID=UPI001CFA91A7|nr:probable adenylate kinase 7, mitochondrial [Mangifera indica]